MRPTHYHRNAAAMPVTEDAKIGDLARLRQFPALLIESAISPAPKMAAIAGRERSRPDVSRKLLSMQLARHRS